MLLRWAFWLFFPFTLSGCSGTITCVNSVLNKQTARFQPQKATFTTKALLTCSSVFLQILIRPIDERENAGFQL